MAVTKKNEEKTTVPEQTAPPPPGDQNPPAAENTVTNFNPLSTPVNEKNYTGLDAGGNNAAQSIIPEHTFTPPPDEDVDVPGKQFTEKEKKQQEQKAKQTANPDLQNASETEKTAGAAAMTDVILTTWEQLYKGANQFFKISEKEVNKLQHAGLIDTRVEVPYQMGWAKLSTVFQDYNKEAEDLLILEPEFKEEIHPLITEELAKAGHGMSNKQKLIYLVSTKLLADGFKSYQFINLKKDYLKFAREQMKGGASPATHAANSNTETIVSNPVNQQSDNAEIINEEEQQEVQVGTTLQEQVLAKHLPGGVHNAPPGHRSKEVRKHIRKDIQKNSAPVKKSAKKHIEAAKQKVQHDPPPTAGGNKKGKGRPPGSKNKPKK